MNSVEKEQQDWEIDSNGLYVATRGFLMRRGYCCANKCRNCPYINWRNNPEWQPIPQERIYTARVSPKAIAGARERLDHHQTALIGAPANEKEQHQRMIEHYQSLLDYWGAK